MTTIQTHINNIESDDTLSPQERIANLLEFGVNQLGMQMGIVSHIVGSRYTVMHSTNDDIIKEVYHLGNTYCSITLKLEGKRVLSVPQFSISEYFRHPAYTKFKLESYIGMPIQVDGERFGTLNFTKAEPHEEAFSEADYTTMTELSTAIGKLLS